MRRRRGRLRTAATFMAVQPCCASRGSVAALDARSGAIVWPPDDTWTSAHPISPKHPDADFGDSPQLHRLRGGRLVVSAGQKNGFLHVLDATTGAVVAARQLLPPGGLGGLFADAAQADGVVFANGNDWRGYGGGETGGIAAILADQLGDSVPPTAGHVIAVRPLPTAVSTSSAASCGQGPR